MKSYNCSFLKISSLLVVTLFLFTGCTLKKDLISAPAERDICISQGWPHDKSDLQPDPSVIFGLLDNGMRYVIKHNEEPRDRVGLYLNIQSGSLAESDSQLGYAHFLEHMLFNGTTHYPPGTLVEYFQSIGMAFGSDTNAHTSFDETVYRILLPDGSVQNLKDGLLVMADYARGALLLEDEVERERGIILAEKRTRDSVSYRLWEKRTRFNFDGTRIAERFPIGTDETLRKADAESLRSFYDARYRPENMILVIVGDVDTGLAEKLIGDRFDDLSAPAVESDCYDIGKIQETGNRFLYVHEPELGSTDLTIGRHWNITPEIDTVAREHQEIKEYVANLLLRNRLNRLVRKSGSPLTKSTAHYGDFLQRIGYASVSATVDGDNWQEGLTLLNITLRQALEYGFTSRELSRIKKEVIADLEKEVQTASSRDSRKIASDIITSLNNNLVYLSPEKELQLYKPVVQSMTVAEVNAIFRKMWKQDNRKVMVAGTAEMKEDNTPEDSIRRVFADSQDMELPSWQESDAVSFPYLQVPEKNAKVARREHFENIDIKRYTFANGTVLNFKKTAFNPNQIFVEVHFGHGTEAENILGLGMLASSVINESGTGSLTKVELEEALAGYTVNVSFQVGRESFYLKGSGLSSELELLMQLITARLLDPGFREDAYHLSMERFAQMYENVSTSVEGMMRLKGEPFLAGGDLRYGLPPAEQFSKLTLEQVREWLIPVFANAALEVSIAGDVDPEQAADVVGRYLGTIDRKTSVNDLVGKPVIFPAGEKFEATIATQVVDKALVAVAWPTDDFWDISRTRRLTVLASVLSERLRLEIREKLGAVYSPSVYNNSSRTAPGYGVLRAMLTVDPDKSDEIVEQVRRAGEMLASDGVKEDELKRSLEPALTSIKDIKETNRYWMESVMVLSSRHPEQLEWPMTFREDYASITAQEISEYAARYLKPEDSAQIIIIPEKQ